jgi:hypothetical protein
MLIYTYIVIYFIFKIFNNSCFKYICNNIIIRTKCVLKINF